jgi:hypothetical protein
VNLTAFIQCEGKAFFLRLLEYQVVSVAFVSVVAVEVEKSTNFEPYEEVVACSRPLYNCAPSKM